MDLTQVVFEQMEMLRNIRPGDKIQTLANGRMAIDASSKTQLVWRTLRRDSRQHTIHALNDLVVKAMHIAATPNTRTRAQNTAWFDVCRNLLQSLHTLSETYRHMENDCKAADDLLRICTSLTVCMSIFDTPRKPQKGMYELE